MRDWKQSVSTIRISQKTQFPPLGVPLIRKCRYQGVIRKFFGRFHRYRCREAIPNFSIVFVVWATVGPISQRTIRRLIDFLCSLLLSRVRKERPSYLKDSRTGEERWLRDRRDHDSFSSVCCNMLLERCGRCHWTVLFFLEEKFGFVFSITLLVPTVVLTALAKIYAKLKDTNLIIVTSSVHYMPLCQSLYKR